MDNQLHIMIYVGFGGMLGAVARFLISDYFNSSKNIPIGTLLVNVIGSLALGALITFHDLGIMNKSYVILFGVGFLGSFTTMSTFAVETFTLGEDSFFTAFYNFLVMMILVFLGVFIGRTAAVSWYNYFI